MKINNKLLITAVSSFFVVLTVFLLPREYIKVSCYTYLCMVSPLILLEVVKHNIKISKLKTIVVLAMLIYILLCYLLTDSSIINVIVNLFFLALAIILCDNYTICNNRSIDLIVYYTIVICSLLFLFLNWNEFQYGVSFPSCWDKNYSGVCVYLFFTYCALRRHKTGILISIIFSLLLNSRLLVVAEILIAILYCIEHAYTKKINNIYKKITATNLFVFTIALTVATVIISYILSTESYFLNSVSSYGTSLNDTSNAIRARSNLYAIELILNDPKLIFIGYGEYIKQVMGVENISESIFYMGYRVVQPHNFLLNLVIRFGALIALTYTALISNVLAKLINNDTAKFIIVYLIMNMFMHSLLSTTYLFALIIVTASQNQNNKSQTI